MRSIPIDMGRVAFVGTGKVAPRAEYVEMSDGSRKASGNQQKDPDTGLPLWTIDVLVDDDDARRAEVVGVTVPAAEEPVTPKWQAVRFVNPVATVYLDRGSGRPAVSVKAEGIETGKAGKFNGPDPAAVA